MHAVMTPQNPRHIRKKKIYLDVTVGVERRNMWVQYT